MFLLKYLLAFFVPLKDRFGIIRTSFFMQNLRFFTITATIFLVFTWIVVFITTSGYVVKFKVSYWYVLKYSLLFTFKATDVILPFIALICAVIFFLSSKSQLAVLRSLGYTNAKIIYHVAPFYLVLCLSLVLFVNYGRPYVKKSISQIKSEIQKMSIARILTEKEVVTYGDMSFYINNINKTNMSLNDIILRKFDGCNLTILTAKSGIVKEDLKSKNLFLVLSDCQVRLQNAPVCKFKKRAEQGDGFFVKKSDYLYNFDVVSQKIFINLTFDGEQKEELDLSVASMQTKQVIDLVFGSQINHTDTDEGFKKALFKEFNFRILNPFYLLLFALCVSVFLVNAKAGRGFRLLNANFVGMLCFFTYTATLYGFVIEGLVGKLHLKGLVIASANIVFVFTLSAAKILYDDKGYKLFALAAKLKHKIVCKKA
jgi:lipopolysaccharide export LptBFGC system permease protein LptF